MFGGQLLCGHIVMLLRTELCVDDLHPVGDLPDGHDVDGHTENEVVVLLWKALLVEQEIDKESDQAEDDIEGDGIVSKDGTDQSNGA